MYKITSGNVTYVDFGARVDTRPELPVPAEVIPAPLARAEACASYARAEMLRRRREHLRPVLGAIGIALVTTGGLLFGPKLAPGSNSAAETGCAVVIVGNTYNGVGTVTTPLEVVDAAAAQAARTDPALQDGVQNWQSAADTVALVGYGSLADNDHIFVNFTGANVDLKSIATVSPDVTCPTTQPQS